MSVHTHQGGDEAQGGGSAPGGGPGPLGVHEVALYTRDLPAAVAFYRDVIGLRVVVAPNDTYAALRVGASGSVLLLFDPDRTTAAGRFVPPHGAEGDGHVAFTVDEDGLAAARRRFAAAGIEVEAEITWPLGGRSVYVRDPAGTSVELVVGAIWPD